MVLIFPKDYRLDESVNTIMTTAVRHWMFIFSLVLALTALGSMIVMPEVFAKSGDDDKGKDNHGGKNKSPKANKPPVANAGPDKTVNEGRIVILSGLASSDPDGNSLTYSWIRTSGPAVTLLGTTTPLSLFIAPHVTPAGAVITFSLTVKDGNGGSSSDTVSITIQNVNRSPVANAGADQTINEGVSVALNGAGSTDPDADSLTYLWNQTSGLAVVLNNNNIANPVFTAPEVGSAGSTLTFQLKVNDGNGGTSTDTVNIAVSDLNTSPVANAGSDKTVNEGLTVVLNGTASSDPDGNSLTYSWLQTSGASVSLSDDNTALPSFLAPEVPVAGSTLAFSLTVNDGIGGSNSDIVIVTIQNVNKSPVANAGPDQTVDERQTVNLNGVASSDPDLDIMTYSWNQTAGPTVTLSEATTSMPFFAAPQVTTDGTTFTFSLSVDDGKGGSSSDTVTITIQNIYQPPVANAGSDQTANEGTMVTVDGSASTGNDASLTYTWTQTAGPIVTLSNVTAAQPTFIAPEKNPIASTSLTFQLSVSDGISSLNDTLDVTINDKYFAAQGSGSEGTGYYSVSENPGQRLGQFSLATWFKTSVDYSLYPAKSLIANKGGFGSESSGKNMNYGIWIDCGLVCGSISNSNKIQAGFEIKSNGTDKFVESSNTYNDGKWHYAVLTYDGTTLNLYIDGTIEGTLATTATADATNTSPIRLGANSWDVTTPLAARYFTGYIDDVRVWSSAITSTEVSNQYNLGDYGTSATVVEHLDMNS